MPTAARKKLPRTVLVVAWVSLLNDFASEMVVPLIPILLATVLAAGPAALGLIEGLADALSNLLKLWAGRHSDWLGARRKPFVVSGYLLSNLVRPLIGVSGHWLTVLTVRLTDRVGKGLRTAPRDALIADHIAPAIAGRAYGFVRALDHLGAVLGALTAAAVLHFGGAALETVIAASAIPGVLAVALIAFGIHDRPAATGAAAPAPALRDSALPPLARRYLAVLALFTLARIPETFVLLRGHELGLSAVVLLLLWATMHVVKVLVAEFAGRQADRYGRRPLITIGWMVYSVALLGLAHANAPAALWGWSLLLGLYFGLTEGAERALMVDFCGPDNRGTAFGWFHMLVGLAAIPAGVGLGLLWSFTSAPLAFLVSALLALVATAALIYFVRE
jgi:MFS family permease